MADSAVDWANLPRDILTSLAKSLDLADYFSFSAVCTSWASVASPDNGMPDPKYLQSIRYLLLPGDADAGDQSESCTLLDVLTNSCHRIDPLPEIRGKCCVGSCFGWLAVVDEHANPTLLNPFTRSRIHLPALSTLEAVEPVCNPEGDIIQYLIRLPTQQFGPWNLDYFRCWAITKIVLSSSPTEEEHNNDDFVALALFATPEINLIFMRPGDNEWTVLNIDCYAQDILYRQSDRKFLVLTLNACVIEIDLEASSNVHTNKITRGSHPPMRYDCCYLVDSDGDLLLVGRKGNRIKLREGGGSSYKIMFRTCKVGVYRLNAQTALWDPITSLGNKSLFLGGASYSVALSVHEIPGLKPNCIYFTDQWQGTRAFFSNVVRDIGVFCLDDKSFELIHPPNPMMTWPPPVWITPPFK